MNLLKHRPVQAPALPQPARGVEGLLHDQVGFPPHEPVVARPLARRRGPQKPEPETESRP